jgi:mannose-6-phosphate isomerase-like protein (cupin superfamily)
VTLTQGEMIIVPHGIEHCPRAEKETHVLLFEPAGTINTGESIGQKTVVDPQEI